MKRTGTTRAIRSLLVITALAATPGHLYAEDASTTPKSSRRAIAEAAYQKALADNAAQREKESPKYQEEIRRQRSEQRKVELATSLEKIEAKLLAKDIAAAEEIVKADFLSEDWRIGSEVDRVIAYFSALYDFRALVEDPTQRTEAIRAYSSVIRAYNSLPEEIPFSQFMAGFIEGSLQKSEAFIAKECGTDYQKLRVGMKLSRAQKCVADFELTGQTKLDGSIVEKYYRDGTYLYVKNGKIVSWNRY